MSSLSYSKLNPASLLKADILTLPKADITTLLPHLASFSGVPSPDLLALQAPSFGVADGFAGADGLTSGSPVDFDFFDPVDPVDLRLLDESVLISGGSALVSASASPRTSIAGPFQKAHRASQSSAGVPNNPEDDVDDGFIPDEVVSKFSV